MARLILSMNGQNMAEYNMGKERYTIGRLPDNDVRIDNPTVSGHHSLIINILNDSFLEDLDSTNGTLVNKKPIKKYALRHGDIITVGKHELRYVNEQATAAENFEHTLILRPTAAANEALQSAPQSAEERAVASAAQKAVAAAQPKLAAAPTPIAKPRVVSAPAPVPAPIQGMPLARLQILNGANAGRELELTKALTTLGKPGVQVAAISRRQQGYYLVHVEGAENQYPKVNGNPIGQHARALNDGDTIEIAGTKMGLFII